MKETKTLQNAKHYSNDSRDIIFNSKMPDIVMGGMDFGANDIDDVYVGLDNNVENILQDLASLSAGVIGDIKIRNEKSDPSGFSQVDRWVFKSEQSLIYDKDTYITLLGKRVLMVTGTKIENIVIETFAIIQEYVDAGIYFKSVKTINNTTLEVEYLDRRVHDPRISSDETRFYVEKTIIREMIPGYGQWVYIGQQVIKFTAGDRTLHYYQRVG